MNTKELFEAINAYEPCSQQEAEDKQEILQCIREYGESLLYRENTKAHFTGSAFVVNAERNKILMVHHNIRNTWSWPGGHADGMADMEAVTRKEVLEETGVEEIKLLGKGIGSLDVFHVQQHVRKGKVVEPHLHLSITYLFEADETVPLRICPEENSGAEWLSANLLEEPLVSKKDVLLYTKLLSKVKNLGR